jgi:hypothetical protein
VRLEGLGQLKDPMSDGQGNAEQGDYTQRNTNRSMFSSAHIFTQHSIYSYRQPTPTPSSASQQKTQK